MVLAKELLIPFTIAIVFTFLLLPVSNKLQQWRIPKAVSILISILLALSVLMAMLYFFYSQIVSFVNDWPELKSSMDAKWESFQMFISEKFNVSRYEQQVWIKSKLQENASTGGVLVLGIFSATTSFLASFALIPIYIFFLSWYKDKLRSLSA
jgi:predicted PurR-regulated permease PerM